MIFWNNHALLPKAYGFHLFAGHVGKKSAPPQCRKDTLHTHGQFSHSDDTIMEQAG
jgi:hypothetical protein